MWFVDSYNDYNAEIVGLLLNNERLIKLILFTLISIPNINLCSGMLFRFRLNE